MKAIAQVEKKSLVIEAGLILAFTFLMILSAYVRIPLFFSPVPLTLQTFILYLSIILIKNKASFAQLIYLVLGVFGLPIFSVGGAGLLYLLGPTGGYLLGFLAVALIFPHLLPKDKSYFKVFFLFSLANIVIYLFGITWLIFLHQFSFSAAILFGVVPFVITDILKIALVSSFYKLC